MYVLCLRNKALEGCGLEPQYSTQLHLVLYWASQPRPPCAIFPAQHFKACYNYMYYTCTCMLYSLRGSKASVATMQMSAKHRDKLTCVHVHVNGLAQQKGNTTDKLLLCTVQVSHCLMPSSMLLMFSCFPFIWCISVNTLFS